jgi:cytochrome b
LDEIAQIDALRPTTADVIRVWDLPTRLFHWLLVLSVAAAGVTGWLMPPSWLSIHVWLGAAIGVLILLRLVWGFAGTAYSRFSSFVCGPRAAILHLREIASGTVRREPGHNPLGAWMVMTLLIALAILVTTGGMALGGVFKQGPFKSLLMFQSGWAAREIHELLALGLLVLVTLHLAGVIFESHRSRENLVASMVTGTKRGGFPRPVLHTAPSTSWAIVSALVIMAAIGGTTYAFTLREPSGVPAMVANRSWATECSACHIAFHPSLLPAKSWGAIMDGLSDHFGEDASLDAAEAAAIKTFLLANAAEHWDTLAANRQRSVDTAKPLAITATMFWKRMHREISGAAFAAKPVGARQNCAACHSDAATGMFAPQSIAIPERE